MSNEAITWAYKTSVGSPSTKSVLLVLANYADELGECYPGHERIADMTELSERTVRRGISELEGLGLIKIVPQYRPNGSQRSNRYVLKVGGHPDHPGVVTDDPEPDTVTTPPDTKQNRQGGTPNPKPAARARKTFGAQVESDEELERNGSLPDDTPEAPPPRKAPRNTVDLAKDFERSARQHYPKGDTRRLVNLTALRANIARWRAQDGLQVHEIALAMDAFWAGVDGYVKADGEPWRRFINVYARVHAKASAPDIADPAYYTDSNQQEEHEMDAAEKWLKEQGL